MFVLEYSEIVAAHLRRCDAFDLVIKPAKLPCHGTSAVSNRCLGRVLNQWGCCISESYQGGSPWRGWVARQREREREIDGGKEEEGGNALVTTDLHNYPVLLPESKCDQTGIIAHWKRR